MGAEPLFDLVDLVNEKIFQIVINLIVVGAIFMWIKDMNGRIVNYFKLKLSDFGRGTKVKIEGIEGFIHHIGFNEVEILIDNGEGDETLMMPVDKFIRTSKIIITTTKRKK